MHEAQLARGPRRNVGLGRLATDFVEQESNELRA
jgi:hypothetical protein